MTSSGIRLGTEAEQMMSGWPVLSFVDIEVLKINPIHPSFSCSALFFSLRCSMSFEKWRSWIWLVQKRARERKALC